jgi:hypothetical protein
VQPVVPVLPELDCVGLQQVAAPALWTRHVAAVLGQQALGLSVEFLERVEGLALA